ncbi:hypothetical protein CDES_13085 [Corynebacterium deserti GIMN1.010]|uniref:Secreted protein n=1 Tax=Corynebacterium deserti GIMN1.010 TaxID=931089 RepID=A0A0M5IMG6_9CORY|nr:hypothetical protein [Corynebacterium deserti]ALC06961.1 hypothetical protein CDES_13085 [Corynebacterium deserti GIMN1.010]
MKLIPATIASILIGSVALVGCAPSPTGGQTVSSLMTSNPTYTSSNHSVETTAGTVAATTEAAETFIGLTGGGDSYELASLDASEQVAARSVLDALLNDASFQSLQHPNQLSFEGTPTMGGAWGLTFTGDTGAVTADLSTDAVNFTSVDLSLDRESLPQLDAFITSLSPTQRSELTTGIPATSLNTVQQGLLVELVSVALGISDDETTVTALNAVRTSLTDTTVQTTPDGLALTITGPALDFKVSQTNGVINVSYHDPNTDNLAPEERVDASDVASAPPEVV